jgi:DedD protein
MGSSGKRGGAGERVLEGRHVIGLFMFVLVFSGVCFTLGYVMARNQYEGQVRAAGTGHEFSEPEILPKNEIAAKNSSANKKKPAPQSATEPSADSAAPASSDWEFYHAGDSSQPDDRLKPAAAVNPAPTPTVATDANAAKPVNTASKVSPRPAIPVSGGTNLQVAALTKEADAMALANTLRKKNFPTFVQPPQGDRYYHVLVGPYADQKSVDNARKGLEAAGFKKPIVKH